MFSVTPPPLVFVTSRVPHQPAALQRHDLLARSGIAVPRSTHGIICRCHTAVAFSLYSTTLDELLAISDAGEIMPPKSTWFAPKLCDGLLNHLITPLVH